MNLPKHIEERFDEIIGDVPDNAKFLIDHMEGGKEHVCIMCGHPALHSKAIGNIKSFIAQILEEEKERLVGEIEKMRSFPAEMFQLNNLKMPFVVQDGKADEQEKFQIFRLGFMDALSQIKGFIIKTL